MKSSADLSAVFSSGVAAVCVIVFDESGRGHVGSGVGVSGTAGEGVSEEADEVGSIVGEGDGPVNGNKANLDSAK